MRGGFRSPQASLVQGQISPSLRFHTFHSPFHTACTSSLSTKRRKMPHTPRWSSITQRSLSMMPLLPPHTLFFAPPLHCPPSPPHTHAYPPPPFQEIDQLSKIFSVTGFPTGEKCAVSLTSLCCLAAQFTRTYEISLSDCVYIYSHHWRAASLRAEHTWPGVKELSGFRVICALLSPSLNHTVLSTVLQSTRGRV